MHAIQPILTLGPQPARYAGGGVNPKQSPKSNPARGSDDELPKLDRSFRKNALHSIDPAPASCILQRATPAFGSETAIASEA